MDRKMFEKSRGSAEIPNHKDTGATVWLNLQAWRPPADTVKPPIVDPILPEL